ncbi:hypothetical protein BTO30_00645 [Domibacillus antri]|uniref:Chemotaxis protein n=1 Tax=Domibacillus antri TaxID=1714264 RepID=A0A1Q8Q9F4_9BACI|nr:methyl-accepting chemotaxis protein [Domibacillus antri]OLN23967.1 hypothetical protein BTO30_00645 [Domibacillus antri]
MKFTSLKSSFLAITLVLLGMPALIIGLISYGEAKSQLNMLGEINLKNDVQFVIAFIETLNEQVEAGMLEKSEAQERIKQLILGEKQGDGTRPISEKFDLGEHGYLFIMSPEGELIGHPQQEGKNLNGVLDPNGVDVGASLLQAAGTTSEGSFVNYDWEIPGTDGKIAPKITYAAHDENWDWNVMAGTYISDFNSGADQILMSMLITLGLSFVIGGMIIYFYTKGLIQPILRIEKTVQSVAEGDFTQPVLAINRKDEVGRLAQNVNKMSSEMKAIIQHVRENAERVSETSVELSAASEEAVKASEKVSESMSLIAESAGGQRNIMKETAASVLQMSGMMDGMNNESSKADLAARETIEAAHAGVEILTQSVTRMNEIDHSIEGLGADIEDLVKQTENIDTIVKVISDIADQTNLLALNASIEAARAGEHGKGFAVVAEEVRKLAEQSASSTNEITSLIQTVQLQVKKAEQTMEKSVQEVRTGVQTIYQANEQFHTIQQAVDHVKVIISTITDQIGIMSEESKQIAQSVKLLENGADETAESTDNIAAATEEELASMEQIASSSESLSALAENLHQSIRKFKLS